MPFMDEPPGGKISAAASTAYGTVIRSVRAITERSLDEEPRWRRPSRELLTGYRPPWGDNR